MCLGVWVSFYVIFLFVVLEIVFWEIIFRGVMDFISLFFELVIFRYFWNLLGDGFREFYILSRIFCFLVL